MESLSCLAQGSIDFERKEHLWPQEGTIVQQKIFYSWCLFFFLLQRRICLGCVFYPVLRLTVVQALDVLYLESSDGDGRQSSQVTAVFVFVQEFEQELAEQKSLLRSVASRGEEILTQSSAVDSSEGLGYALKVCRFLSLLCFPVIWKTEPLTLVTFSNLPHKVLPLHFVILDTPTLPGICRVDRKVANNND